MIMDLVRNVNIFVDHLGCLLKYKHLDHGKFCVICSNRNKNKSSLNIIDKKKSRLTHAEKNTDNKYSFPSPVQLSKNGGSVKKALILNINCSYKKKVINNKICQILYNHYGYTTVRVCNTVDTIKRELNIIQTHLLKKNKKQNILYLHVLAQNNKILKPNVSSLIPTLQLQKNLTSFITIERCPVLLNLDVLYVVNHLTNTLERKKIDKKQNIFQKNNSNACIICFYTLSKDVSKNINEETSLFTNTLLNILHLYQYRITCRHLLIQLNVVLCKYNQKVYLTTFNADPSCYYFPITSNS